MWRYHPERDTFELFAEGGGNPWTLHSTARAGHSRETTAATAAGFTGCREDATKELAEARTVHAATLLRAHLNMDHEGYAARFAMTSVVYEDGKLPGYEGQLISGMALTSRMQGTRFVADGSTFRTVDTEAIVTTADRSFRPVDTVVGPDGAIYIADSCDIRMDHTDPRDTWDKSCGGSGGCGPAALGRSLRSTSLPGAARSSLSSSATSAMVPRAGAAAARRTAR